MENNDRIRVRTSIPGLQNKVQVRITGPTDVIYWYLRFNIQLDEESVSGKTMNVTDTDGYIMRTVISYKAENNLISISPLDTYEENRYYLLNISKKVRSAKGKHLKSTIHIMFKLLEGKVSNFKVLDKGTKIPPSKPRPPDYDATHTQNPKRVYTPNYAEQEYIDRSPPGKMASVGFFVNPALGFVGLLVVGAGALLLNTTVITVGVVVCILGALHIIAQLRNKVLRSKLIFNRGVSLFNRERYQEAEIQFRRALATNPDNELAQFGIRRTEIHKN